MKVHDVKGSTSLPVSVTVCPYYLQHLYNWPASRKFLFQCETDFLFNFIFINTCLKDLFAPSYAIKHKHVFQSFLVVFFISNCKCRIKFVPTITRDTMDNQTVKCIKVTGHQWCISLSQRGLKKPLIASKIIQLSNRPHTQSPTPQSTQECTVNTAQWGNTSTIRSHRALLGFTSNMPLLPKMMQHIDSCKTAFNNLCNYVA